MSTTQDIESTLQSTILEKRGVLLTALIGIIIVIGAWSAYSNIRERDDRKAMDAWYLARKSTTEVEKQYTKIIETYPRTRASYEAGLALGDLALKKANYPEAKALFEKAAKAAPTKLDRSLVMLSVAHTYELQKQFAEASGVLEKILSEGDRLLQGEAMLGLVRIKRSAGDEASAAKWIERITKELPGTEYAAQVGPEKTEKK